MTIFLRKFFLAIGFLIGGQSLQAQITQPLLESHFGIPQGEPHSIADKQFSDYRYYGIINDIGLRFIDTSHYNYSFIKLRIAHNALDVVALENDYRRVYGAREVDVEEAYSWITISLLYGFNFEIPLSNYLFYDIALNGGFSYINKPYIQYNVTATDYTSYDKREFASSDLGLSAGLSSGFRVELSNYQSLYLRAEWMTTLPYQSIFGPYSAIFYHNPEQPLDDLSTWRSQIFIGAGISWSLF